MYNYMKYICIVILCMVSLGSAYTQVDAWRNIALEYVSDGTPERAIPFYKQAISLDPVNGVLRSELAYSYQLIGEYNTALHEYTTAIGLVNAPLEAIKYNMGNIFAYLDKKDDAIRYYSEVIEMDEQYIDAYLNRAIMYTHQKRYREAEKDYHTVLTLNEAHIQHEEITLLLEILSQLREFPVVYVDKSRYQEKKALEEELNNKRARIENRAINQQLGQ